MYVHDLNGDLVSSSPIGHHKNKKRSGWKGLLQDRSSKNVFSAYEVSGHSFIGKVNLSTGEVNEKYRLAYRYVDKIAVIGNFVYYIYRPFESSQKRFLYKERLPNGFNIEL